MIMAIAALIDRGERPGDADVDAAITNICRCGIYPRLREAIRGALAARPGAAPRPPAPGPGEQAPNSAPDAALPQPADQAPPEPEGLAG
jgi:isoquinoline 1-oxidoreductase alpha subunit